MKQSFFILLLFSITLLGGCGVSVREGLFYEPNLNQPSIKTTSDPFLNKDVSFTNKNCSGGFCSQFKIIGGDESYLYVGYRGDDWLFIEQIHMKIKETDTQIKLSGSFDREVMSGGTVEELLSVRVDKSIYEFIKSSLGKTVIVRLNGKQYYKDFEFDVSDDPKKGQWSLFIENFKPKFDEEITPNSTST